MATIRQRLATALVVAVVGAVMFVVASAYLVARDQPRWLAGAVGALAFPLLPMTWHVIGERRRRARSATVEQPAPRKAASSLAGIDRFWLRLAAVAIVVIGPMIAIGRFDVARAAWHHGLWFVPAAPIAITTTHGGPLATIGTGAPRSLDRYAAFLRRVPAEAELVVTFHKERDDSGPAGDGVAAWGNHQLLALADAAGLDANNGAQLANGIDEVNAQRDKLAWLAFERVAEVKLDAALVAMASDGWRATVVASSGGPSEAIRRELARAPATANAAIAFVPRSLAILVPVRAGAAWLVVGKDTIAVEGRAEAADAATAQRVVDDLRGALDRALARVPVDCRPAVEHLVERVTLDVSSAVITGRAEVSTGEIFGAMMCAVKL